MITHIRFHGQLGAYIQRSMISSNNFRVWRLGLRLMLVSELLTARGRSQHRLTVPRVAWGHTRTRARNCNSYSWDALALERV